MSRVRVFGYRYAPAIGGAENYTRRLLQQIGTRVDVDVVALLDTNRADWLRVLIEGVRDAPSTYEVDGRRVTTLARWPPGVRGRLRAFAPAYHLPLSPVPTLMGRILTPQLRPMVTGVDVVHNVFMGREAFSLAIMRAAHGAGLPFVFTPLRHQRPLGWSSPAFRDLYRGSDAIVALTNGEAAWLAEHGAPRSRMRVIGLGPQNDPSVSPDAAFELIGSRPKIVLFVGQLHPYKGFRELIEAARRFESRPDVLFAFAGPDVRGNARYFARAGSNVRWLGPVDNLMRDSLLNACAVLCVPSSRESFGSVVVEAWASGKPVIGGPAPATRELIDEGVDGWTVPQDATAIARRIGQVLDDESLAQAVGKRGREKVARRFSWESIALEHVDIYERLASRKAHG